MRFSVKDFIRVNLDALVEYVRQIEQRGLAAENEGAAEAPLGDQGELLPADAGDAVAEGAAHALVGGQHWQEEVAEALGGVGAGRGALCPQF